MMNGRMGFPAVVLTGFLWACGNTSVSGLDLATVDGLDAAVEETFQDLGPDAPKAPVVVDEDFRFLYGYAGRIPGDNLGDFDFFYADPTDADTSNDMSLTENSLSDLSLDCHLGCFLDRGMRWMAIASEEGQDGTYTVKLARFTTGLKLVSMDKFGALENVKHLAFAGDFLYFSQPQECEAQGGIPVPCYIIKRLDLNKPGTVQSLLTMPTKDLIQKAQGYQYYGYFTVGEDLKTLLFLLPTNVSQSVWVWRDGKLIKVVDDLCAARDLVGNCIGSGTSSLYHDNDPAALSPDGKHVVFALVEDNADLRLYRHEIETDQTGFSVLMGVPSDYYTNACYNRAPWQYTSVGNPMRFTHDGSEVMFIGSHSCGDNKQKPWTNIVRLALDRIGSGEKLTEADFRKVTDNPEGHLAKAIAVSWFDLSPSGEYTVFAGTPTIEEDGSALIKDTSARHYKDAEIYVTRTDGTTLPVQLTNRLEWEAVSVLAIPTP
ncbi:MAG: hypothetical protein ISR64_05290 [Deltaproteobacteria bacterium]|nr:hypothetical protein [Deltaproteobacteria bacterium]